jgi:hypothetical protein
MRFTTGTALLRNTGADGRGGPRFEPDTLKVYAALRVGFKEELEKYFHQGR